MYTNTAILSKHLINKEEFGPTGPWRGMFSEVDVRGMMEGLRLE